MGISKNFSPIVLGSSVFFFRQYPPSVDEVFKVIKSTDIARLVAPPYYVTQMIHVMKESGDAQPFQKMKLIV